MRQRSREGLVWRLAAPMHASVALPVVLLMLLVASGAGSFVPEGERIANAAATANKTGARTQALQLELALRVGDREPIGTGELVTHPNGLARLELRDAGERVERHLLLGTEHSASRNGELLDTPRAFLPPLFLLQADSTLTLRQALLDFGLDVEAVALAPCGKRVCYVLGDRALVAEPEPPSAEELERMAEEQVASGEPGDSERDLAALMTGEGDDVGERPYARLFADRQRSPRESGDDSAPRFAPRLWLDASSFEIVRIEAEDGVTVEFGPFVAFKPVRFPEWLRIREPNREPVQLDVLGVVPVNAPAAGFKRAWLLSPGAGAAGTGRASGEQTPQAARPAAPSP